MGFWNNFLRTLKLSNDSQEPLTNPISNKIIKIEDDSFTLFNDKSSETFNLEDIESIFAFKIDLVVVDSICLEFIFKNGSHIRCNEDQIGFVELMSKLNTYFKLLDEGWYFSVMQPAFETNLTLIFDRQCRNIDEVLSKSKI